MRFPLMTVALLVPLTAAAGTYKCTRPDGAVIYQQTFCDTQSTQKRMGDEPLPEGMPPECLSDSASDDPTIERLCARLQFAMRAINQLIDDPDEDEYSVQEQVRQIEARKAEIRAHRIETEKSHSKRRSYDSRCPCYGNDDCRGPRGGSYCITAGGYRRYR